MPPLNPVRTVVVPAAGWGTRFLPATKAVPKELLPIIDKPVIHYGLEEALDSGLTRAVIVTSPGKAALEDYFRPRPELDDFLADKGKSGLLSGVDRITDGLDISYVTQRRQPWPRPRRPHRRRRPRPRTLRRPPPRRRHHLQYPGPPPAPRRVRLPTKPQSSPCRESPKTASQATESSTANRSPRASTVSKSLVEKPSPDDAPSNLGIVGRYVLTPAILDRP